MISNATILEWRQYVPWKEQKQVEQDLILHAMIQRIYADPFLSEHLAFRGGTCLNKLFFPHPYRYSEDLDFVQIHAEKIGPIANQLQRILSEIFDKAPTRESKKDSFRLNYSFIPEDSQFRQKIKIEINTREHFAIQGYVKKTISLDSQWLSGKSQVITFCFEELMATKLRALYQRRKGRDLFDLWTSQELNPVYKNIAHCFLQYMEREGRRTSRQEFTENIDLKMTNPTFLNDMTPLIRNATNYNPLEAKKFVTEFILKWLK